MIRRPPRSTLDRSSAASDVYKRQHDLLRCAVGIRERDGCDRDVGLEGRGVDAVDVNAVSYTHLRAHETVLDLVCRLLLEKKTTKTTKYSTTAAYDNEDTQIN